jgi:hypothetical protein
MCSTTMSADTLFNIYSLLYYFGSMLLVYKWLLSSCQWTKFWTASDSVAHISKLPTLPYLIKTDAASSFFYQSCTNMTDLPFY